MFNITSKRRIFYIIPVVIIVIGIVMGIINKGFNLDTDFIGGTSISFDMKNEFDDNEINSLVEATLPVDSTVQKTSSSDVKHGVVIKTVELSNEQSALLKQTLIEKYNLDPESFNIETVSSAIGSETQQKALIAILVAVVLMLIYIALRFEILSGVAAVMSLVHDVLIMLAVYVIFKIPVNSSFIAAILTILGYSINATIVVFDRIRENARITRKEAFQNIVNTSVWQSMGRSINTTLTTLVTIVLLYFMGVDAIKEFALPIIVGVVAGFYSSVFLSGNFWVMLKNVAHHKNVMAVQNSMKED